MPWELSNFSEKMQFLSDKGAEIFNSGIADVY